MQNLKPFLKWAGGKRQLIPYIKKYLPENINKIKKYVEPFVGGGALLFFMLDNYNFEEVVINDLNKDLINTYKTIKDNVDALIETLERLESEYLKESLDKRKDIYYKIREKFNSETNITRKSAYLIFLNRTCFNGLYRVNKKGLFNVPYGKYKNPKILDKFNLIKVSKALEKVNILSGDFEIVEKYVDEKTFVYFDPPYKPISKTASFNSYQGANFDDGEQIRLSKFYSRLSNKGAELMLSNSDPKNIDKDNNFFDELYDKFLIIRIDAKRAINSKASKRGKIKEILVLNYSPHSNSIFDIKKEVKDEIFEKI